MDESRAGPQPDIEPTGEVRAAIAPRFTSSAEPQTRLLWDYFKVSAQQDGTFSVTNSRNGFSKTYRSLITSR